MKRSTDRIIVSHAGALHRPEDLRATMASRRDEDPIDDALAARMKTAVAEVVKLQHENGVDVVNDGEYTKRSWQTYSRGRLSGIEFRELGPNDDPNYGSITARESRFFPEFFATSTAPGIAAGQGRREGVFAVGPLKYTGHAEVQRDIEFIKAAAKDVPVGEVFLTALAPATIEHWMRNQHYKSQEEMLFAIADAMHDEYKAITDAGIMLQLDDPDLPDGYHTNPDMTVEEYKRWADVRVEAINHAIRDCPEELVRLHICWGSSHHPHTQDIPFSEIIDIMYKCKAECYSFEAANPIHEWEWVVFKDHPLPAGKSIMPGILGHAAREFVEHPQTVAQRVLRYANLVGRENVIIGTDCGLQRTAHASITWAKFRAAAEGARIATAELWK